MIHTSLFPWNLSVIPLLRLHTHQSGFVKNSVNQDILLVDNDVMKLAYCRFGLKNLIIEVLHRLGRHLCNNFSPFVYTAICLVVVRKYLNVRKHGGLVLKLVKISAIIWVFEGVWVICTKPSFLQSLDIPVKISYNSLVILNQQTLGRTDHIHCFQAQLTESGQLVWF